MAKGIIGSKFTFTVLFLDVMGDPIVPAAGATIEIFYFNAAGAKQVLTAAGSPMTAVPGDPGRYAKTITIPTSLTEDLQLYGIMKATDSGTGEELVQEQSVDLDYNNQTCNYQASFIKPANFP